MNMGIWTTAKFLTKNALLSHGISKYDADINILRAPVVYPVIDESITHHTKVLNNPIMKDVWTKALAT